MQIPYINVLFLLQLGRAMVNGFLEPLSPFYSHEQSQEELAVTSVLAADQPGVKQARRFPLLL